MHPSMKKCAIIWTMDTLKKQHFLKPITIKTIKKYCYRVFNILKNCVTY